MTKEIIEIYIPSDIIDDVVKIINNLPKERTGWEKEEYLKHFEAVRQGGSAFRYVPEHLKDKEICLEAVKQRGGVLEYVPEHLRQEIIKQINDNK